MAKKFRAFVEISLAIVRLPDDISLQLEAQPISAKVVFFITKLVFVFKSLVQIEIIRVYFQIIR